jgi:hypothetical protein
MPHIPLDPDIPGIRGPMAFRPETARPLNEIVEVLLQGPHSLTPGERELIATFVSSRNCTQFCLAAAFCMYNRYVDGLGTSQHADPAFYRERGKRVAREGYVSVSKPYISSHAVAASHP